jgi:hypothetical protein
MNAPCIHGFRTEECASCRECKHGLPVSRCGRCRAAASTASRRAFVPGAAPETPPATYQGYEILFSPAVSGWLYRAPDAAVSRESYRSEFLARKAIDHLSSEAPAPPARKRKK